MYIAVCDDQIEELEKLTALLQAWQSDRPRKAHGAFAGLAV